MEALTRLAVHHQACERDLADPPSAVFAASLMRVSWLVLDDIVGLVFFGS